MWQLIVLLGVLCLTTAQFFPSGGYYVIREGWGCDNGYRQCGQYVARGSHPTKRYDLLLKDKKRPMMWELRVVDRTRGIYDIRSCRGAKCLYWVPYGQWMKLDYNTDGHWKLEVKDHDKKTYRISSTKNCDKNGRGQWPCGRHVAWGKAAAGIGLFGDDWLYVENKKRHGIYFTIKSY